MKEKSSPGQLLRAYEAPDQTNNTRLTKIVVRSRWEAGIQDLLLFCFIHIWQVFAGLLFLKPQKARAQRNDGLSL